MKRNPRKQIMTMEKRLLAKRRLRITHKRSILIRDLHMRPLFVLDFYNEDAERLTWCHGGGNIVADALQARGINPRTVIFTIWDVGELEDVKHANSKQ